MTTAMRFKEIFYSFLPRKFYKVFNLRLTTYDLRLKLIWLVVLSLALFASGCATAPGGRVTDSRKRIYLKDLCDRYSLPWQWDHISQTVDLKIEGVSVRILAGSNILLLGKEQVRLNTPVMIEDSSVMLPRDFKVKVMDRFPKLFSAKAPSRAMRAARGPRVFRKLREVVIDAGHGGKDPGAIGVTGMQEKTVVLDVARRLKKLLEAAGVKVTMTRQDDTFISLAERTAIASRSKAELFVSIHANASPVRGVHGAEVYCLKDLGTLEKNEAQRQANHKLMFKNLAMKKGSLSLEDIIEDMLYTHKQSVSPVLAENLVDGVAQTAKAQDRGEKQSRFFVLRNTLIPAVLVEIGFVTNPKEGRLLKTDDYRQRIAEGLAKGILGYGDGR
ncbi:MAG TPA: hypothetical protein DE315_08720 [Candidatus Omnitrophica bacterium]|nr:hypothetical protein [Candidatus Omnitrophota bacterium]HCI45592.1 hypothetical protein [Candidatus Omnitrophota bacterium]